MRKVLAILLAFVLLIGTIPAVNAADSDGDLSTGTGSVIIPFTKNWDDDNNAGGYRPETLTVRLYKTGSDGKNLVEEKVLTAKTGWACTFDISNVKLQDDNGNLYQFTVEEVQDVCYKESAHKDPDVIFNPASVSAEWTRITPCSELDITTSGDNKSAVITKKGGKYVAWTVDPLAPAERQMLVEYVSQHVESYSPTMSNTVFISGTEGRYGGMTVTKDKITFEDPSNWSHFAYGLYYKSSASANAASITNELIPQTTTISGEKIWNDANNQDGKRPASITINLWADDVKVASQTVTAENGWKFSFVDVAKYNNGVEIVYTVTEEEVADYETAISGYIVTNTHIPEKTSVSGSKTWNDNNDQDGKRPTSITINLLANGEVVATKTVTDADNWAWTFADLDKYANGTEITYTITEEAVEGYTSSVNGFNVTNTHEIEKTSVSGTKTWEDADNQDGKRPASITINLLADGVKVDSKTVGEADNWAWTFDNLDKYANGAEISYTIAEEAVAGYTTSVNGYNVTNTHTPEVISISGTKTWNDNNDQDGKRPDSITIKLMNGETVVATKTVTEADGWAWEFTNLPKYAAGVEIEYTIAEESVDGYTATVEGFNITNTHEIEKTSVSGAKTWDDANDQDGIRPDSITINLLADGVKVDSKTVGEADNWAWTFNDLDKYANGTEITYTITEEAVEGYTAAVDGFNVTNTHVPATTEVSGSKIWDDAGNQDGIRPASITINLLADGEVIDSVVVNAEAEWKWSFTELPVNKAGEEIKYTITENAVEGYTTVVDGYNVTNTHTPAVITVSGTKTWDDADDQDGIRPKSITVNLLANGEKVDSVEVKAHLLTGKWEYTFENLPKFENGVKIEYTVEEVPVDGYTATVNGFDITNTHTPATTEVSGSKTWNDADNQDGKRPETITINLLANGKKVDSKVVTAADEWKWSFNDLPKNEEGKAIKYTITEEKVEGYTGTVLGFNVVNVHIPETITISGTKTWDDAGDQDGIRPNAITVNLLANGEKVASVEVKAGLFGTWKYSFKDMPKYENGKEIVYTVEEAAVEGYTATVEGFDITNCHEPDETELTVKKVWDDKKDENKKRPDSVKVTLYANGKSTGKTLTLSKDNNWSGTFKDLPKNDDGKAIKYTVKEATVGSYKASYSYSGTTATVTNTFSDIPVTGDTSGVLGFAMIMAVSAAALVVLTILGKRKFRF